MSVQIITSNELQKGGFRNGNGYRLLDCAGDFPPRYHEEFMKTKYGKFEEMMSMDTKQRLDYLKMHIPQAVHIDLSIATFPGLYEPYAMYPPEIFQKYARLLGINRSEHIVLYGRQHIGGMMFPSRIAWLFKYYGHDAVSVMDGGLKAWIEDSGEITSEVSAVKPGNWEAKLCSDYIVTYEELSAVDSNKKNMFDKADQINFFDSRPREQFEGKADSMLDPNKVHGSHVPGTKCAPAVEMIDKNGHLKNPDELKRWLLSCGFKRDLPVISQCLRGIQACMLNLVIEDLFPSVRPRVYHGSCLELQNRDPERISE
uniref:Rhodanese domain-containing protein n=1 Tax=Setaria digitata TaxID=48799 RepID=A0A915PHF8_9BILA